MAELHESEPILIWTTLPLETIKRISKFLSDNGVITRDVSAEVADNYTYEYLVKATGKTPEQLGLKQ